MPGNIANASPSGVLPQSLCIAFIELHAPEYLRDQYHDGTIQQSQLVATSRKTFQLSERLSAAALATLYAFWTAHAAGVPFAFYNPYEPGTGLQIGSNYDGTGASTQGRYIVVWRGNWVQVTDVCRTNVGGLEFVEVG
jgi:hypothetical protein